MAERLLGLPERSDIALVTETYRFEQNMNYDTSRIRGELGYIEDIDERRAMSSVAALSIKRKDAERPICSPCDSPAGRAQPRGPLVA
jgi:hypothetical protein